MIGAIIGDTIGSAYEFHNVRVKFFPFFVPKSRPTDDSIMTLAVAEILQNGWQYDRQKVVETLKKWGRAYPKSGYGGRFRLWLSSEQANAYGSYGNGAAMRVSAVGWYAESEAQVKEWSRLVTEVTHNHPEGLKGAEVTAMCVYYARQGKSKEFIKAYVEQYYNLDFDYETLRATYAFDESCQKTVPQAIYCFLISKDFEDCIRTTISIGGDCDTTAAISCAIAQAFYKDVDKELEEGVYARFPEAVNGCDARKVIASFKEKFGA